MKNMSNRFPKPSIQRLLPPAANLLLIAATLFGCFLILEYGSIAPTRGMLTHLAEFELRFALLNLLTLGVLLSAILILCNRVWLSCLLTSCICGIVAIINHYVIQFHTMPLSFLVLKNFNTAMNVISGYRITLDVHTVKMLFAMAALILLSLFVFRFFKRVPLSFRAVCIRNLMLVLFGFFVFYAGYFGSNPIKPANTLGWSWQEAYFQYGYVASTVESYQHSRNVVVKPDGYTEEILSSLEIADRSSSTPASPDIILILNETFYDLQQITDPQADISYMSQIDGMDNLLRGYAICPAQGGSTNSSEYEVLTSNSMKLISATPFSTLSLEGANSVVSHLNRLGYSTLGSHSEAGLNYSRLYGYSSLGFQTIHFEDSFTNLEQLPGGSFKTDESLYRNLIRWYEEAPQDDPRFLFLLTIQNHGDWNHRAPEYDIVHTQKDYDEYTESVNEFLTCIYYSDKAFKELTDYFAQVDRPVIVCMLGDHAPSFAANIADAHYTLEERNLRLRAVPLLIWANYELEETTLDTMSMNYVVPTLLEIAGIPLSPYYSYQLQMKQQVPILTAYGDYYDAEGNLFNYNRDAGMPYEQLVDNYFSLEYHNILNGSDQSLFLPYESTAQDQ